MEVTRLLTLDETAERLRRSPNAVRWMCSKKVGPKSAKIAGRVMFREADVEAYINEQFERAS